jgi:hypothetical protein
MEAFSRCVLEIRDDVENVGDGVEKVRVGDSCVGGRGCVRVNVE